MTEPPTPPATPAAAPQRPVRPTCALVMGIINVTPDSFSDGGHYLLRDSAIAHGHALAEQGADMLDIGGESTRPGAVRIGPDEELSRVMPVVERLVPIGISVSIDTMRAGVAAAAVLAGATIVNDVSGGLADPAMLATVASLGVDYICQRWRGPEPATLSLGGRADSRLATNPGHDPVADLRDELAARRDACLAAGIEPAHLILDPGIGFGTSADLDWTILLRLNEFASLGHRLLIGPSRKRFLDQALPEQPSIARRDAATAAVAAWCAFQGAWAVRVHDMPGGWAGVRVARCLTMAAGAAQASTS